ncbi:hypothetical protein NM208_g15564 [Fusarium decemcellulare]|uniref:Uncharacterized protein n=1 Tax=Fusarium decemcellulare TaxID=57161 RepID=A0ACC1REI3_9HYPO|nr:hypothetical protein NM208_g15564 [Fusarium decemcellulare]
MKRRTSEVLDQVHWAGLLLSSSSPSTFFISVTVPGFQPDLLNSFARVLAFNLSVELSIVNTSKASKMAGYDYYDDDDYYSNECCIGCCRAGDYGGHDGCGPCYCRRSFKPDYDRTVYPGWSLGHYYPGADDDWEASSSNVADDEGKAPDKSSDKEKTSEKVTEKASEKEATKSNKDSKKSKSGKISKTTPKSSSKDPEKQ